LAVGLWDTGAMSYTPKAGDIVVADGQAGTFKVLSVSDIGLAQLQPFNVSKQQVFGKVVEKIPRKALHPFKKDSSQAALRVVREATEGK
jgi:hypothetical protein